MAYVSAPVISPRERVPGGCCKALVEPDIAEADAIAIAARFKSLADPTRVRIVDALRKAAPEALCQCELTPLFEISQQALSKHLKTLVAAGIVGSERRGLWTYYFLPPGGLREVGSWLG
jgi:ArsR family transcriptional regulator, arsenate/arsenite/antimonite-responsive transcriptional repressor